MENKKTSLRTGDCLETVIESVAFGGDGVGRIDGLVIFVPFTVAGDRVRIRITSVKKNYLRGELLDVVVPSEFRVHPRCLHYGQCGGCQYQHIAYDRQLQIKKQQVLDAFERIGGIKPVLVEDCLAAADYGYRGKAEFHIARTGEKRVLGFMAPMSNRLIEIDRCEILEESINRACADFRAVLTKDPQRSSEDKIVLWSDCGCDGQAPVSRRVKGRAFQVTRSGFFQANVALIDRMVDAVMAHCCLTGNETVLDCFSGSGLFSLFAADHCRHVYGIEIVPDAVRCATLNAQANGCDNATFLEGRAENMVPLMDAGGIRPDLILLDPPRTGCGREVIPAIIELAPARLVYISCDPGTQARDISRLKGIGYRLDRVQPLDMFPQTKHIEVIASLSKQ